jgi:hypothetical protein
LVVQSQIRRRASVRSFDERSRRLVVQSPLTNQKAGIGSGASIGRAESIDESEGGRRGDWSQSPLQVL